MRDREEKRARTDPHENENSLDRWQQIDSDGVGDEWDPEGQWNDDQEEKIEEEVPSEALFARFHRSLCSEARIDDGVRWNGRRDDRIALIEILFVFLKGDHSGEDGLL